MFLTQKIEIKINKRNINHFINLNYNIKLKDIITIPTEHLNRGSQKFIDVKCDICGTENNIRFQSYMNNYEKYNLYTCIKCKDIKSKKTSLERYGVENYRDVNKIKQTNLKKYGVENVSQSQIIKNKKKNTNLKNWGVGNVFQSDKIKERLTKTLLLKYGVEHPLQNSELLEKSKQTCLKNNGVEYPTLSPDILKIRNENNLKKYGVEHYTQTDKYKNEVKQTNLKKYGTEWYMSSKDFKNKSKITNLKRYGVEYNMQNETIYMKAQINGQKAKTHKDTGLFYRGTYEKDFLDYCFNKNIKIEQGKKILYEFDDKKRVYFSDYYLKEKNLIIEIKSSYYYDKYYDMNISKMNKTKKDGYNFIFIIDKNYKKFNESLI